MPDHFNFETPPFDLLNDNQKMLIQSELEIGYYTTNEYILKADSKTRFLIVIHKGLVEERKDDELFTTYNTDDFFDARSLFSGLSKHDYISREETITYEIPISLIKDLGATIPGFMNYFQASLTDKHERQHQRRQGKNLSEFILTRISAAHCEQPQIIKPDTSILQTVVTMKEHNCDSLLLNTNKNGLGIVTRTDLLEGLTLAGYTTEDPVYPLASNPLVTVNLDDFLFDAMILMTRHHIERVVVMDDSTVIGILPLPQVLSLFSTHSHVLALSIQRADSFESLKLCAENISGLIRNLHNNGVRIPFLMKLINTLNEQVIDRLFRLHFPTEVQSNICFMVLGSEGRGEQIIKTDQDNALIIRQSWKTPDNFQEQLDGFSIRLQALGYPPCPGHIMVNNPHWVANQAQWIETIQNWRNISTTPDNLMKLAIILDARPISGDYALFSDIEEHIHQPEDASSLMAARFARVAMQFGSSLTLLGDIKTDSHQIDIKKSGIFPIVHGVRSLALEKGVQFTGTLERLDWLEQQKIIDTKLQQNLKEAFCLFQRLKLDRLLIQNDENADVKNVSYDNLIDIHELTHTDRDLLRHSLHIVKKFKQKICHHFRLERF